LLPIILKCSGLTGGAYPVSLEATPFGKNTDSQNPVSVVAIELSGKGTAPPFVNIPQKETLAGEQGGIVYAPLSYITTLYNPFIPTRDYTYKSDSTGSKWVLYLELSNSKFLYRTVTQVNLLETSTIPEP